MAGSPALAEKGENLGRYAFIGEPTNLAPIRRPKGVFYVRVTVGGKAGRWSDCPGPGPHDGRPRGGGRR